jgi:hypothetical protein
VAEWGFEELGYQEAGRASAQLRATAPEHDHAIHRRRARLPRARRALTPILGLTHLATSPSPTSSSSQNGTLTLMGLLLRRQDRTTPLAAAVRNAPDCRGCPGNGSHATLVVERLCQPGTTGALNASP